MKKILFVILFTVFTLNVSALPNFYPVRTYMTNDGHGWTEQIPCNYEISIDGDVLTLIINDKQIPYITTNKHKPYNKGGFTFNKFDTVDGDGVNAFVELKINKKFLISVHIYYSTIEYIFIF